MADITDERLREIIEGTYCGFDEGAAISAELLAARADLREAVELLRTSSGPGYTTWLHLEDATDWNTRYGALLEKHKETL